MRTTAETLTIFANLDQLDQVESYIHAFVNAQCPCRNQEELAYNLHLALHELIVNIITHAYANQVIDQSQPPAAAVPPAEIQITATADEELGRIDIHIYDHGIPFNSDAVTKAQPGTLQEHGFGLFLIEALLDQVSYRREGSQNHWHLIKQSDFVSDV